MPEVIAALDGGLIGALIGAFVVYVLASSRRAARARAAQRPLVNEQVVDVLSLVSSSGIVVSEHDEIAYATPQARHFGLVRGTRLNPRELLDAVREVRRTREAMSLDFDIERGIGVPRLTIAAQVAPMRDGTILVLAEDRGALARIDETKRDFVANVTHELKTPIGAIVLLTEAIDEAADDPDAVRHFASRLHTEANRLSELVRQIIALSRLQSDEPLLRAQVVKVGEVIAQAASHHRAVAEAHRVQLVIVDGGDLEIVGDATQLGDAVGNLIHNAIVYSDSGARVAVTARLVTTDDDQLVEISVADNGIGIKAEELERIFERFYRVDYSRSRDHGGTGLGLSIVKHIVAAHGGAVTVWSQLGQGSTFTLRIPARMPSDHDDQTGIAQTSRALEEG